jgi:protein-disulfide isomerase
VKNYKLLAGTLASIAAIFVFAVTQAFAQSGSPVRSGAKPDSFSPEQRENIEKIIHDYLVKNPAVLREVIEALQAQEAQEKEGAVKNISALRSQIFSDPMSPVSGNPKGDVTVVVFFDYACGYCKRSVPELDGLAAKDPNLRIVYKEFPILGERSKVAATAALAANRQGKYTAFHNALFRSGSLSDSAIKGVADQSGVNYDQLQKDMADPKFKMIIDQTYALATALHIDGTPAYIVGDQLIPGAVDIDSIKTLVDAERAKLGSANSSSPK